MNDLDSRDIQTSRPWCSLLGRRCYVLPWRAMHEYSSSSVNSSIEDPAESDTIVYFFFIDFMRTRSLPTNTPCQASRDEHTRQQ